MLDALYTHLPDHLGVRITFSFIILVLTVLCGGWIFPSFIYVCYWLKTRIQGKQIKTIENSKGYHLMLIGCRAFVLVFGLILAAEFLGIEDNTVWTLIVSLLGFSLSFSFRDTLTHVVAGLALMFQEQPKLGEEISIIQYGNDVRGTLRHIGVFNCELEGCVENKLVTYYVPNATIVSSISAVALPTLPTSTDATGVYIQQQMCREKREIRTFEKK